MAIARRVGTGMKIIVGDKKTENTENIAAILNNAGFDTFLMDLNLDKCRDLFEIIEARDCRKSTVIISQMPVANWYQLFGDNTYADACLSRMTSKAYRLDFPGRDRRVESK